MTSPGPRTVVLVSGGGTNLQAIIDETRAGRLPIELCRVISDRHDAGALERARRAAVEATVIDYAAAGGREAFASQLATLLEELAPGIIVMAGFMRILPEATVTPWIGRMLNVHPSLLPRYPGLDTYRRVLAAGDREHGTTVHFVTPELDAGPAIIQYRVGVRSDDNPERLAERVRAGEYLIYPRAIGWLASGRLALREGRAWLDDEVLETPVIVEETALRP
ncbi:MAG: phosphoribosylglycinamide formyltransferase [Chromatiales bacterium]|nr:phosphoribosylglycinamide formyltransferase [Chromatiales bacterium]